MHFHALDPPYGVIPSKVSISLSLSLSLYLTLCLSPVGGAVVGGKEAKEAMHLSAQRGLDVRETNNSS